MGALNVCHVLYIGNSEAWRIRSILAQIKDRPILSVSDTPEFVKQGGIIGLVKQDDRLKFEINLTAATHAGLRVSAQLANLANLANLAIKTY